MHPIRGCNIRIMSVYPTQSSCVHWAQVPSCVCTTILTCKYWNHSHLCSFTMCFIHNSKAYAYVCMTDCFGQPYCTSTTIFLKVEYQHVCSQKLQHVMSKVSNIWACEIPISDEMKIWYPTWQNSNIWCNRIPISNDTQVFPDQQETDLSVQFMGQISQFFFLCMGLHGSWYCGWMVTRPRWMSGSIYCTTAAHVCSGVESQNCWLLRAGAKGCWEQSRTLTRGV